VVGKRSQSRGGSAAPILSDSLLAWTFGRLVLPVRWHLISLASAALVHDGFVLLDRVALHCWRKLDKGFLGIADHRFDVAMDIYLSFYIFISYIIR
jgi:hypothetical protein